MPLDFDAIDRAIGPDPSRLLSLQASILDRAIEFELQATLLEGQLKSWFSRSGNYPEELIELSQVVLGFLQLIRLSYQSEMSESLTGRSSKLDGRTLI